MLFDDICKSIVNSHQFQHIFGIKWTETESREQEVILGGIFLRIYFVHYAKQQRAIFSDV